jgi:cAMP response element-binding protein
VIQSPSSVIQNAGGQLQLSKNVILVSTKPNSSVIQTTGGAIQVLESQSHSDEESLSNDGDPLDNRTADRRRREILTRRPSYRKILSDLGGAEISGITN